MFAFSFTAGQAYMPERAPPPNSSNMSARAAFGARVPPSIEVDDPSARRMTNPAMPPMPLVNGSTTPMTKAAATAASTALPPSRSTSTPASAARGCSAVTIPLCATGSVLACDHSLRTVDMRGEDSRARLRAAVDPSDLLRFRTVADVACSPDGTRLAFTVSEIDRDADDYRTSVWVALIDATADIHPRQLTNGPKKDASPRWSPDGKTIAFLSDRERDKPQLYVMPSAGGPARRLTDRPLGVLPASGSPGGARILFA